MKKLSLLLALLFVLSLFVTTSAHAFDGQRKGFLLGFGVGSGRTSTDQKVRLTYAYGEYGKYAYGKFWPDVAVSKSLRQPTKTSENKLPLMTDFKIGFAPDNSWAIYYTSKVSWFRITNVYGDNVRVANGLGAAAVSYWFKPQAPSLFIAGGFGFSTWALPFEENPPDTWTGSGLFVGGGYEGSRHVSLESYLCWGDPKISGKASIETFSFMLTFNVLGY
jgi:hypothetical protein